MVSKQSQPQAVFCWVAQTRQEEGTATEGLSAPPRRAADACVSSAWRATPRSGSSRRFPETVRRLARYLIQFVFPSLTLTS